MSFAHAAGQLWLSVLCLGSFLIAGCDSVVVAQADRPAMPAVWPAPAGTAPANRAPGADGEPSEDPSSWRNENEIDPSMFDDMLSPAMQTAELGLVTDPAFDPSGSVNAPPSWWAPASSRHTPSDDTGRPSAVSDSMAASPDMSLDGGADLGQSERAPEASPPDALAPPQSAVPVLPSISQPSLSALMREAATWFETDARFSSWDLTLADEPGAAVRRVGEADLLTHSGVVSSPGAHAARAFDNPVRVVGATLRPDGLWLEVEVLRTDACRLDRKADAVITRGWLRQGDSAGPLAPAPPRPSCQGEVLA
jgi:hypothetical protein